MRLPPRRTRSLPVPVRPARPARPGLRKGDAEALLLARRWRRWSKVAAVLFAIGAITGMVLSFELGILWPGLMKKYGAAFGFPFAIEGLFFSLEAIFVAICIYGWDRMPPWAHFWSGVPVPLAILGGTTAAIAANSWTNKPGGFTVKDGQMIAVQQGKVFFNDAFWLEFPHMFLAAYIVAGFVVAGVYAVDMLRGRRTRSHRLGFLTGFVVAACALPVQIVVGDTIARYVFDKEPLKFAAIELQPSTGTHVPETLGGVLIDGEVGYGIKIPDLASLLAGFRPSVVIKGLEAVPVEVRPTVAQTNIVHWAFDIMVGTSSFMLATSRWFLLAASFCALASIACLESGWVVTEVGRQPLVVVGHLLTRDAVATQGNLWPFFSSVPALYLAVDAAALRELWSIKRRWEQRGDHSVSVPYGPEQGDDRPPESIEGTVS
ncbi:cytochrome ubiquinol oxidase subunit I [Streptomyces sp. NPDC020794]|uniref:cytochrome ubiquinol oxidase subunit I n=1 Tax=unclassified Streptomyces TaxID=2593676 RepID=UPI0036E1EDF7